MLIITLHDDTKNAIKTMKLPQKCLLNSQKLKTQLIFLFYLKRYIRSIFQNVFYTDFLIINRQLFLQIDPNISDFLIVNFGAPQISILGTVLYKLCVAADMTNILSECQYT